VDITAAIPIKRIERRHQDGQDRAGLRHRFCASFPDGPQVPLGIGLREMPRNRRLRSEQDYKDAKNPCQSASRQPGLCASPAGCRSGGVETRRRRTVPARLRGGSEGIVTRPSGRTGLLISRATRAEKAAQTVRPSEIDLRRSALEDSVQTGGFFQRRRIR
jgi:hypothetical protein